MLDRSDAAHLVRRTGFGVTGARLAPLVGLERSEAVDHVLDLSDLPPAPDPAFVSDGNLSNYQRWYRLVWWWMDRMRTSPAPIVEKMTLFWHGHFTSGARKVGGVELMHRQNQRYRTMALGSYRDLAQAMAIEPAMLRYLDNRSNRRVAPQENFGRELLELFTLGVGTYDEADVMAMTRAWTGHGLDAGGTEYLFRPERHDHDAKVLFGISHPWDGPEALDEVLLGSQAVQASRFLVAKLWSFLVAPVATTDPVVIDLADGFRASNLSIQALVRSILLHDGFWAPAARGNLLRSPTEFFVAGMEALGLESAAAHPEWWMEGTGQVLYEPPNVSGWRGGASWVSTSATWARASWASYVRWQSAEAGVFAGYADLSSAEAVDAAFDRFGVVDPSPATRAALEAWHTGVQGTSIAWSVPTSLVLLVLMSPDFQVA